jgi:hypothetical protein
MNALFTIQQKLKAPKSQYNSFGKYSYRNQEDILEAVKPLLAEAKAILTISDEIVEIGGSLFVKSTATLLGDNNTPANTVWSATAYAKHSTEQKGMNDAQITGAASSYARKYALNGLFLIDDTKDADTTNTGVKADNKKKPSPPTSASNSKPKRDVLTPNHQSWNYTKEKVKAGLPIDEVKKHFDISEENIKLLQS